MLNSISIKNYALIEDISIDFNKGLTVITGETGVGKSIIIDSIDLLLGSRATTSIIRTGANICTIIANFDISNNIKVKKTLTELAIEYDCDIIIRRQIELSGKSKAFINDMPVSINTLSNIGKYLIDFYAQHKSNMLFDNQYQKQIVDDIADNKKLLEDLSAKYDILENFKNKKNSIEISNSEREKMLDLYNYQVHEIDKANLNIDDENTIENELPKLKNAEKIQNLTQEITLTLYKENNSILDNLSKIIKQIDLLGQFGIDTTSMLKIINESFVQIDDVYREINNISQTIDSSPESLNNMLEKQQLIKKLKLKYGNSVEEILAFKENLKLKITELSDYEFNIELLDKEINLAEQEVMTICNKISDNRKKIAKTLAKDIIIELEDLNMKNVQFEIDVQKQDITRYGYDKLEFMFNANHGEKLYPLSLVASGGEISRVMLALATTISNHYNVQTIIFDEIDTGTSGKTGDKIGKKLKKLSTNKQIISISHLAQIASNSDNHIKIYKETKNERNVTKAKILNQDEHIEEIAKIISGEKITEHALKHAKEMVCS
ncbi:MAG: DNA repair protein RecN [Endomicrobiaceae bacterium]|nr:DNA repair protein RecN [Endomicrobiaceae bacterium]MDD5101979.1 DNA repair protein RecN [Endomicrobiaceae bacterium]